MTTSPALEKAHAQKIIDGLREAIAGKFARVTIDGEIWVREKPLPSGGDVGAIRQRHEVASAPEYGRYLTLGTLLACADIRHKDRAAILAALTVSEAERERMRVALKPFADELDGAWGGLALDHEPIENFIGVNIRVGDLRRAKAALGATP